MLHDETGLVHGAIVRDHCLFSKPGDAIISTNASPTPALPQAGQGSQSAACVVAAAGEVARWWCALRTGVVGRGVARLPLFKSSRSRSVFSRRINSHRPRANQQNIREEKVPSTRTLPSRTKRVWDLAWR